MTEFFLGTRPVLLRSLLHESAHVVPAQNLSNGVAIAPRIFPGNDDAPLAYRLLEVMPDFRYDGPGRRRRDARRRERVPGEKDSPSEEAGFDESAADSEQPPGVERC